MAGNAKATAGVNMDRLRELASFFAGTRGVEVTVGIAAHDRLYVVIGGQYRAFSAARSSDAILDLMGRLARGG